MHRKNDYKIGIVSDTHGSKQAMLAVLAVFEAEGTPDLIIHLGDVLYHGPRNPLPTGYGPAELASLLKEIPDASIVFVRGNCDNAADEKACGHKLSLISRLVETPLGKLYLEHGDLSSEEERLARAEAAGARWSLSGHTHVKRLEQVGNCIVLNPGSPTLPKDGSPSCAIIDAEGTRLYNTATGACIEELRA